MTDLQAFPEIISTPFTSTGMILVPQKTMLQDWQIYLRQNMVSRR